MYSYDILLMETFTRKNPTDETFTEEMSLKCWVKQSLPQHCTAESLEERINIRDVVTTLENVKLKFLKDVRGD